MEYFDPELKRSLKEVEARQEMVKDRRNKFLMDMEERHKKMWNNILDAHNEVKRNGTGIEQMLNEIDKMLEEL